MTSATKRSSVTRAAKPGKRGGARAAAGTAGTLADAPPEKCFWVNFGPVLKNLRELQIALASGAISDEQFAHHVGPGRNDFASWVEGALKDPQCAKALRRAKTRRTALKAVEARLAGLN
jgi:hypothetical protein